MPGIRVLSDVGRILTVMTTHRPTPPLAADERTTVEGWLDFYRATLLLKCEGLDAEQLRTASVPPSPLTLRGLMQHAAEVERNWFRRVLGGEYVAPLFGPPSESGHSGGFDASADPGMPFAEVRAVWEGEVAVARERCAGRSPDDMVPFAGGTVSLRWVYQHLIGEYARHCGHADLIRERLDGVTGV